MSAMSDMSIDANNVLDLYIEYMNYDNNLDGEYNEVDNEDKRWDFMEAAVDLLQKMTDRKVDDELDT